MAKKSFTERRRAVRMDQLVAELRAHWQELPDKRNRVIHQSMGDVAMSAFALFALKYPSLLQFDTQTQVERDNLQQLFGIEQVCSDTQMRHLLDGIDPHHFADQLGSYWEYLSRLGITQEYRYRQRYHIVSIDGVEHFRSSRIKCSSCLERTSGGQTSYSHSMLCAALMHPDQREVFTLAAEPIVQQDGHTKNDCELRAVERLLSRLAEQQPKRDLLIVEDALYANGPHVSRLLELDYAYVINVKPKAHDKLFCHFATRQQRVPRQSWTVKQNGMTQTFRWVNDLAINDQWPDLRVNMLVYEERDRKGRQRTFSWITSEQLSKRNVEAIMRIGRCRWKIENETPA